MVLNDFYRLTIASVTMALHLKSTLSNFRDKLLLKLSVCHYQGNNVMLLETPLLEHQRLEDLHQDLVKLNQHT